MKIAFEAPIGNTQYALSMSDYIFAIAPMLKVPEYAEAVRAERERYQSTLTFKPLYIDNGEYEGRRMSVGEYLELCYDWRPEVVVAPDVIGDAEKTVELASKFFEELPPSGNRPFRIMVVLQGLNDDQKIACGKRLALDYDFDIIGLGLGAFFKVWRGRLLFVRYLLKGVLPLRGVHILGIANLADLCFWSAFAESVDTSLPFHLAQEGKDLIFRPKSTSRLDWSDPLVGRRLTLATLNIEVMRKALDAK